MFRLSTLMLATYWLAMFLGTHVPLTRPPIPGASDKTLHLLAYGGLAVLVSGWLAVRQRRGVRTALLVVLVLAVYGAFDELTQPLVNRIGDVHDWYADMIGTFAGITLFALVMRIGRARFRAESRTGDWASREA